MDKNTNTRLICTMCKKTKETYSEIVYSQGERVCQNCKKITQPADNAAFDRYMGSRESHRLR